MFDGVYIISIPKNIQYSKNISKKIERNSDINVKIFNFIKKETFEVTEIEDTDSDNHAIVVGNSHKKVCKDALKNGYEKIIIFEDDAEENEINEKIINKISEWIKNNEWDIFFLGYISTGFVFPINCYINRLYGVMCTHAYCINKKMMYKIAEEYNPSSDDVNILITYNKLGEKHGAIDDYLRKESFNNRFFGASPSMYYQKIEPMGVKMARENHVWENISVKDWPNYVNNTLMFVSIITCLIFSLLCLYICVFIFYKNYKKIKN